MEQERSIDRLGFNNALGIAFIAGILNIIPYVGPLIGELVGVVLAVILKYGAGVGLPVNIWVFTLIVILLAGHIGGVAGMLVAIPSYTVVRVIASRFFPDVKLVRRLIPDPDRNNRRESWFSGLFLNFADSITQI